MTHPQETTVLTWLVCIGILLLGFGILGIYVSSYDRRYAATPENELTLVEDIPDNVSLSEVSGKYFLKFTMAKYRIQYASDMRRYKQVLAAVKSGAPIQAWVSTKNLTDPDQKYAPLYKLSFEGRPVLTYAEAAADKADDSRVLPGCSGILLGFGVLGLYLCFRNNRRHAAWERAVSNGESRSEDLDSAQYQIKKIKWATILVSVVTYAIVIGINLSEGVQAKSVEAFGAAPFGLPVVLVVVLVETLLFLPMPWVNWHAMKLAFQAMQDGTRISIVYLLTVGSFHPHLRRSQIVCLGGVFYVFLIMGAWIVFTAIRGI